ncbi:MAG: CTP synthase [Candidatus Absconditabacteria bacterium]|nr:CTP synthase [Candidatus Absconditabacteria bacterium]MDD3868145.1 CTP synthase [Candidatus Absconditabacteria bacterium]MDD4714531.1 CTP synthase [Candidatus Absconditabacteria bacterium]
MKVICVTGGVLSGIGKGITGASIGAILKAAGYQIFMQKFDGYLNVDPGTMNPIEHGEVFVTDDGTETDLDIGHYERYIDTNMTKNSSWTTGRIYQEIFERERKGEYLGKTVQVISHVASLVKEKIKEGFTQSGADISIVEIGGTVGDMENEYLIESVRQLRQELGAENVVFVHLVYVPYLGASKELKTKPAQNSVRDLRSRGIDPDILVVRADMPVEEDIIRKLSLMCGLPIQCVIPSATVKSIYEVPVNYQKHVLGNTLLQALHFPQTQIDLSKWEQLVDHIQNAKEVKKIAMVGKYVSLEDAYYSLNEGLKVAGYRKDIKIQIDFVSAEEIEKQGTDMLLGYSGICVPGGFGTRGIEGMVMAAQFARENKIPYLGICLGSQIMAIEFARNVLGYPDATSEEFFPDAQHQVIHLMEHQKGIEKKGGTMRLGSYDCALTKGSLAEKVYGKLQIAERHRHRYEFNNAYRPEFEEKGFLISGTSLDGELAEVVEIKDHPYMIATQAHPELKSRPLHPHPLFVGFIEAMKGG